MPRYASHQVETQESWWYNWDQTWSLRTRSFNIWGQEKRYILVQEERKIFHPFFCLFILSEAHWIGWCLAELVRTDIPYSAYSFKCYSLLEPSTLTHSAMLFLPAIWAPFSPVQVTCKIHHHSHFEQARWGLKGSQMSISFLCSLHITSHGCVSPPLVQNEGVPP